MTFYEQVQRNSVIEPRAYKIDLLERAWMSQKAIVFIYAKWSGTAIYAWRILTSVLAEIEDPPKVVVVNSDEIEPNLAWKLLSELPQGKGETFWIKDQRTVARLSSYGENDVIKLLENIRLLTD